MTGQITQSGTFSMSSDADEVEELLNYLEKVLAASCLDDMSAFHLRCAVVEVVNNCIQHAYQYETGHPVEITYQLAPDRVHIFISDQGPAFSGNAEQHEATAIDESGRGLEIINALVSQLRFEHKDGWNICHLEQQGA